LSLAAQITLTGSFQIALTAPALTTLSGIILTNTDTVSRTVRLCFVPPGQSAVQGNSILWDFPMAPNDFIDIAAGQIILGFFTIQALASSAGVVNLRISGA